MNDSEPRPIEAELQDVRRRLAAEREAAEAARRAMASMLERVTDAFMALDTEWRFAYVNGRAAEILGRRPEHLLGRYIHQEFPEGVGHPFHHAYRHAAAEQKPVYVEEYYPPLERWFEHRIYPSSEGLSIFFRDVTERRRADDALRDSERRLRLFIEQIPAILWTTDLDMRVTSSQGAGLRWLGLHQNELVGVLLSDYFKDRPEDVAYHRMALGGESVQRSSEWRGRHFESVFEPLLDSDDKVAGMIAIAFDVTDRRRSEEALRTLSRRLLSAQEEERRRVARELHDEIGQVLTAVKIQLQSLLRAGSQAPVRTEVEEAVRSIDSAIDGVRGLSLELRPSLLDDLGLTAALRWLVERVARETGVDVALAAEPVMPRLPAEVETTCFRVVQEALTNVARHAAAGHVAVELRRRDGALELVVRDDGKGFDLAVARQRAAEGACMGLSGMEERVRLAGGEIAIEAGPLTGTTVRVRFEAAMLARSDAD
jgi:PAS domain S-box-containing protein